MEAGEETLEAFRKVTDKPVKAIVYTHNHIDHVAAVKAFTTEEDVAAGKVDIYAHETLMQGVINWASTVGPIEGRRTSYTAAAELEGEADLTGGFAFTSPDVIQAFPTDVLLEMLTTRIDSEKSIDVDMTLGIRLPDVKEGFGLEIRRGVVQFHQTLPAKSDVIMVADRAYLNRVLVGDVHITGGMANAIAEGAPAGAVAMMAAIDSGDIKVEGGTKQDVQKFFSYFDEPVDVGSIKLIVR